MLDSSLILPVHISAGLAGILSGAAAMSFRKGSPRHVVAGKVFVASMLTMAAAGVYLAIVRHKPGDILGGTLTLYLVASAWMTARRKEQETGAFDWCALLIALGLAAVIVTFGLEAANSPTGLKYGYSVGPYGFLGSIAVVAATGDIRLLIRGGISGEQRIGRHLWRMCFAFFIAAASIFLARQHLFPAVMRKTGALLVLSFLPLILMVFWLIRIRVVLRFEPHHNARPIKF